MHRVIIAVIVAVGFIGLSQSSSAQSEKVQQGKTKKLDFHPSVARDKSARQGRVGVPSKAATGQATRGGSKTKTATGAPVAPGQSSEVYSTTVFKKN